MSALTRPQEMRDSLAKNGYAVAASAFSRDDMAQLKRVLDRFHSAWLADNADFYKARAVNSAYLTAPRYLNRSDRLALFRFIAQEPLVHLAETLMGTPAAFLNTQLFFDPADPERKNYWHRDIQYSGLSALEQQAQLPLDQGFHVRIALKPERGIELIPGTHLRWDTQREFDTRTSQNGKQPHHALPGSKAISLDTGDMLVFSANTIHRGLYGKDRMAFDILYCTPDSPHLVHSTQPNCMPDSDMMQALGNPPLYQHSLAGISKSPQTPENAPEEAPE